MEGEFRGCTKHALAANWLWNWITERLVTECEVVTSEQGNLRKSCCARMQRGWFCISLLNCDCSSLRSELGKLKDLSRLVFYAPERDMALI